MGKEVRHVWVNSSDVGSEVRNEKSKVIIHVGWGNKDNCIYGYVGSDLILLAEEGARVPR